MAASLGTRHCSQRLLAYKRDRRGFYTLTWSMKDAVHADVALIRVPHRAGQCDGGALLKRLRNHGTLVDYVHNRVENRRGASTAVVRRVVKLRLLRPDLHPCREHLPPMTYSHMHSHVCPSV